MAVYRQISNNDAETSRGENIEILLKRVKKDLTWVVVSAAVAIGSGLLVGNFIKI